MRRCLRSGNDMFIEVVDKLGGVISEANNSVDFYSPVINFPDYQWRLYQNKPDIKWKNKVHERLVGFKSYSQLPADISWCLMHHKEINRQEKQNMFYNTIV